MKKLFLCTIILALFYSGCGLLEPKFSNIMTCAEIGLEDKCIEDILVFDQETPEIYISAVLDNAKKDTVVSFTWQYLGNGAPELIDTTSLPPIDKDDVYGFNVVSYLGKPESGWPTGEYEIILTTNIESIEPVYRKFSIE